MGAKGRAWLMLASFAQALMCMAGALTAHYSGESAFARSVIVIVSQKGWSTLNGIH